MKSAALGALVLACVIAGGCTSGAPKPSSANLSQAAIYNTQLAVDALRKNNLQESKDKIGRA